jgi:hypothetical protein
MGLKGKVCEDVELTGLKSVAGAYWSKLNKTLLIRETASLRLYL